MRGKHSAATARIATAKDHPRGCGENAVERKSGARLRGSPPRMRGKPVQPPSATCVHRITPADAGKTCIRTRSGIAGRDHPRGCGENQIACRIYSAFIGSPPQVRGKRIPQQHGFQQTRITPAGAGKTNICGAARHNAEDHPRRCGENNISSSRTLSARGSPPQVRGKPSLVLATCSDIRITPAGAGKTWCPSHSPTHGGGSPPQVRGKLAVRPLGRHQERITPAGAGKTASAGARIRSREDHPRRCGENSYTDVYSSASRGSPPQVRGKPHRHNVAHCIIRDHPRRCGENVPVGAVQPHQPGITPAGAGKTQPRGLQRRYIRDHPRRCGENKPIWDIDFLTIGSPPQVRGKRLRASDTAGHARITPAGAGKTGSRSAAPQAARDHPRRCGEN